MARGQGLPLDPARLRAARTAAGLSQRQLAEHLGTTRQQVIQYEQGAERPEVKRLAALAAAVGVGVGDLVEEGALPTGLAGLRIGAGLTLAAAADAVRAQLPPGTGIACSRPVLAEAERGTLPPSWAPPPAAGAVRNALGVAYRAEVAAVAAAWQATFPAPADHPDSRNDTSNETVGTVPETTPPVEVPAPEPESLTAREETVHPDPRGGSADTEARAVTVLLTGDPDADHPYLWVHVDGERIGHLGKRRSWDLVEGWAYYSRPTDEERRTLSDAELGGRPPEAVTTLTDPTAAARELLPQVLEEGVSIGSLRGYHTGLKVRPQGMDRWELYRGRVPGRYDIYTGSTCHGWLQNAPGGGHTAHTPAGPVLGGPWPTRGEAVAALWAHLNAPLPPPWLSEQAYAKRSVRKPFDTRPMCPYTDAQLAAVRVSEAPGSEKGNRVYEIRVAGDLVGTVRRLAYAKRDRSWEATANAKPHPGQVHPPRTTRGTREDAVWALLARPGPLWADPTSETLHEVDPAPTPQEAPGSEVTVDMGERIGPGWALRREGPADAHTWILLHQGRVRGKVRRYRPRHGGLSKGWEALAGEGGPRGVIRRSATEAGKFGERSSFLWRSRDLAAWGIATNPDFAQPNPAWAHRRPRTP
ncbi:helix-turn-helix transcriptional regulator [Nocardiopsis sp. NPDC006139]|uniref:helix-turn-helix transcriptional regulator n=1 Tax=Nocardiopsis sp. NPDC006139 TaxID=3154578 RepID=UPI0033B93487